jgi:hypothetical protein
MRFTKKATTNHLAVINYSQVFHQPSPACPFDLLRPYPTDWILSRVAKVNTVIYLEHNILLQNMRVLKEAVFEGIDGLNEIVPQFMQLLDRSNQCVFTGPIMSLIIKEAMENYVPVPKEDSVNRIHFGGDLFKAILAYNELFYDRPFDMETFEGLFTINIQQQSYLRRESFLKLSLLLKFAFISKFISEDELLKGPALEYCRALEIGTVWGLASFLMHLFRVILYGDRSARHVLDSRGAKWPVMEQFILRKADLAGGYLSLHKQVVPKPLYEIADGQLVLLDYNYFTYGLDQGLLFSIYNKTSLREGALFKNYNAFKAYFGLNYFEQYFIGGFITKIFSKWNHKVVATDKYQDYIVRAGNHVFVFEIKMTEFNANGLDKESFSEFKTFIDNNFLTFKKGSSKPKGLGQIIRQIGHLANDPELAYLLSVDSCKKLTIYPIIVYSDANLDMNGVNEYVNQAWSEHINAYTGTFQAIRPAVMINGGFFMTYYYLLRKDPAVFAQWLNDYLKSVGNLKKRYRSEKEPIHYLQYNKSFAQHMHRKIPQAERDINLESISADFDLEVRNFGKD